MKMSLRWFGPKEDTVSLKQIRQIPGVKGVVTSLPFKLPGEVWNTDEILYVKNLVEKENLTIYGIESVNISDDIKSAGKNRDEHIDNYIKTIKNLSECGIRLICYNFMPVFDWTRTDLFKERPDKATVFAYDQSVIDEFDASNFTESFMKMFRGHSMPGWEPERMKYLETIFKKYEGIDSKILFNNLVYFLDAISDTCEKYDVKMAIHPDDPSWSVFSLPRIVKNKEDIERILNAVDKNFNGITLCTGSLASNPDNKIEDIIQSAKGRIHFAHIRNIKYNGDKKFEECAHLSSDGSLDMFSIVKSLYQTGFDGLVRPDHGRQIWEEKSVPGYGLYDRALGASYINGLWEAVSKQC